VGMPHTPWRHRIVPVVHPLQFVADLGESTVDGDAVLGGPGSLRPFRPDLDTDECFTVRGDPRATAPVPAGSIRPSATAHIEDAPGGRGPGFGFDAGIGVVGQSEGIVLAL